MRIDLDLPGFILMASPKWTLCYQCSGLTADPGCGGKCSECGILSGPEKFEMIDPTGALGLIGWRGTGKSVYLATLLNQLMNAAPEWRVTIPNQAFSQLNRDYQLLRQGQPLDATRTDKPTFFSMKVQWQSHNNLNLLMWDAAGEVYSGIPFDREQAILDVLRHCPATLVCISGYDLRSPTPNANQDGMLAEVFHRILARQPNLQQVIAILVAADVYGDTPAEVDAPMIRDFHSHFQNFPAVLKNAGIPLDIIPLSNIGLGNSWDKISAGAALSPYNVLEPLRRALPNYLPKPSWWKRLFKGQEQSHGAPPAAPAKADPPPVKPAPAKAPMVSAPSKAGSVFISYRRDGGSETARVVRKELETRGWRVFLDVEDLNASYFDERLLHEIDKADNFLLILSPGCLERCNDAEDWLRREIAHALLRKKRVVPLMKESFVFPRKETLPADIRDLLRWNSVPYSHHFYQATMDKLVSFLHGDLESAPVSSASPTSIRWKCGACGKPIRGKPELRGKKVKCPGCGDLQVVPAANS